MLLGYPLRFKFRRDAVTVDMAEAHSKIGDLRSTARERHGKLAKALKSGERGRNRTYNLLIKSRRIRNRRALTFTLKNQ
jgi:hypothetical protein